MTTHPPRDGFRRCAAGDTVRGACEGLTEDLLEQGVELPSVYLLVGGRLRCQAARGYFQVVDGFRPGTGVIGRTVTTGEPTVLPDVSADPSFVAARPDLRGEGACRSCSRAARWARSTPSPPGRCPRGGRRC